MSGPALSVIVPSVNGWSDLERALAALECERADVDLQVLVPDRCGEEVRARVADRYPWAQVIAAAPRTSIPSLRALALDRAVAPSVAVIEDHVLVPTGWARSMLEARKSARVVGGAVRNAATRHLVDWAAFLCEYAHLLPGHSHGRSAFLAGNNTVYDRALLLEHRSVTHAGVWEDQLHEALRRAGVDLASRPDIVVDHDKHFSFAEYWSQRFLYARSYAGTRFPRPARLRRVLYGLGSLGLPPVLVWRIVGRALGSTAERRWLWRSLPLIALFTCAWGAGELVGYWFGPGDALGRVR